MVLGSASRLRSRASGWLGIECLVGLADGAGAPLGVAMVWRGMGGLAHRAGGGGRRPGRGRWSRREPPAVAQRGRLASISSPGPSAPERGDRGWARCAQLRGCGPPLGRRRGGPRTASRGLILGGIVSGRGKLAARRWCLLCRRWNRPCFLDRFLARGVGRRVVGGGGLDRRRPASFACIGRRCLCRGQDGCRRRTCGS